MRPVVGTKACISYSEFGKPISPFYFDFKIKTFAWTERMDIGVMAGYRFNKNRTQIEFGIRQSSEVSGWELAYSEYVPSSSGSGDFINSRISAKNGPEGIIIPFLLSTQIAYWDSLKLNKASTFSLHCNFIFGINIYHRDKIYRSDNTYGTAMISPVIHMKIEAATGAYKAPHYILPELGFSLALRKKQKEWATIACYYMLRIGRHGLFGQHISIYIADSSTGNSIRYNYDSSGRGSGLLLEISKKIFYPQPKRGPRFIKE